MSARPFPSLQSISFLRMRQCSWVSVVFLAMLMYTQTVVMGVRQAPLHLDTMLPAEWMPESPLVPPHFGEESKPPAVLLHETLPRFNIDPHAVPVIFQEQVHKLLHDYTSLYRRELQGMLHRASLYLPMIKLVLKQQNLPSYFAYVPLVESAFDTRALHPVTEARGLWQLMPDTARSYGLRVSPHIDERLDPFRATRAAAQYLRELHDIFGADSPLLVLAAYNFGENNVGKAIVRSRTRDIWSLLRKRQIPHETRDFLVKIVAFWVLVTHPQHFQLTLNTASLPKAFTEITFPHAVSLTTIAQQIALPVEQLRDMNPQILVPRIPAYFPVRIPPASMEKYGSFEVRLPPSVTAEGCCARLVVEACTHPVETGESLSTIAEQYHMDVNTLKLLNQLEGAKPVIRPGQKLRTCEAPLSRFAGVPDVW
jgi:membrane-bound lytic murein transglycosylase D